uniref:Protein RodZ, contains Xre-like HTH and DUF4115 domains n=1 Tax=Candidatus Kentrum sp. TUN TaxID=2126343 RepID=A0A451A3E8_9GAMM|nr:MAG: protein RodZ, contains Xre-like HTH and DUF4115 domains [Candidatus Kentron sp. TUN]VFK60557.1 MAG: protein RodZ, contains Xre-like HTH and DUF4115 domains [Candidatus Kentron sp. TUN]VFK65244.1 MAG: protein RodZ, contains Xre-like HTH and DUF4115 domains [Candidatus Kentron sp. TUN]
MITSQTDNPAVVPMDEESTVVPPMDEENKGPGRRLREARQMRNLSINDVAARLRLSPTTIYNLEKGHYDKLHGPAFIRGYLNAYARLLNIASSPILDAFDQRNLAPPVLTWDVASRSQIRSNHIFVRIATYLIILTLVSLVFSWWRTTITPSDYARSGYQDFSTLLELEQFLNQELNRKPHEGMKFALNNHMDSLSQESLPHAMEEADVDAKDGMSTNRVLPEIGQNGAVIGSTPPTTGNLPEPAPVADRPVNSPASEEDNYSATEETILITVNQEPSETSQSEVIIASTSPTTEDFSQPMAATDMSVDFSAPQEDSFSSIQEATNDITEAISPTIPKVNHLVVHLSNDSWMEIYDGLGERLYYQLGLSGQTYEFQGSSPFQVTLGYAHAAKITYNGELFDHTPYIEKELAEFSVGSMNLPR